MSIKSATTVSEVPGVINAVDRLQELAQRMRSEEFGFHEHDVGNIDRVIEALHELHEEGGKIHEKLETETIKASVLRHTLQFLPGLIKKEIHGAVSSARQSNEEELTRLQENLKKITDNTEFLKERHAELEKENSVLHPERDQIRDEHEDIITQLNQRMAEKASKQIILNETRDKLRDTNQKIVDLEEGILQLKEDLIQERADARMEKKRLKKAVYDTTLKAREQKEINVEKKKELDDLQERVFQSESHLDEIRKSVRRYETSRARLEGQERALTAQLERETKHNQELEEKGTNLEKGLHEQEEAYGNLKAELKGRTETLKQEIKADEKKKKKQKRQKADLEEVVKEKMHIRQLDEGRVNEKNSILQTAKQDLAWKAQDAARIRQENIDMEERIKELGETHESIVSTFQKQIEEMRGQLAKERKERMQYQNQRDTVEKEVDDFKVETQRYMNEMNRKINEGRQKHDELTREGTMLQKKIREDDDNIRTMQDTLNRAKTDLNEYRTQHEGEVKTMETEIETMTRRLTEVRDTILEKEPSFHELQANYDVRMNEFDTMKKEVVALKNKKFGLEDACKRANKDVEKLVAPTEKLRTDIKEKREESMEQLKRHSQERTEIEKSIYATGCKLRTVLEENDKFDEESQKLRDEITSNTSEMKNTDDYLKTLETEQSRLKEILVQEWGKDSVLEETFAARDQELVESLGQLVDKTGRRKEIISGISRKLDTELYYLAQFLENVAKRRPKDSREGKKPDRPSTRSSTRMSESVDGESGVVTPSNIALETDRSSASPKSSRTPRGSKSQKADSRSATPKHSSRK